MEKKALGIDLGSRWQTTGSALLTSSRFGWASANMGVITWPKGACTPTIMAATILSFVQDNYVGAVSIDGPQGWRDPAADRAFVGRECKRITCTPGKTGTYGVTYPGAWKGWVSFSIALFEELLQSGHFTIASSDNASDVAKAGGCLLLECFPTSTWRTAGLKPLGGHGILAGLIDLRLDQLRAAFNLPVVGGQLTHDNLQALVAALPAAALLGGRCVAVARGEPARMQPAVNGTSQHRIEGLIWDGARGLLPV